MKSPLAKVLHPLCGKPMIRFLIDRLGAFKDMRVVCVVGHDADVVRATLPPGIETVLQWPPRGTGDAVRVARRVYSNTRVMVVAPGDAPMISVETIRRLLDTHRRENALATVLTSEPEDPAAYGRVVQDSRGNVRRIVEAGDADAETLRIRRINTGFYAFDPKALLAVIGKIGTANNKGEFYLTDVIELLAQKGRVSAVNTDDADEAAGVNSLSELARLEGVVQKRLRGRLMENGVQIPHPQTVYLEPGVKVSAGVCLLPGTHLTGTTTVDAGSIIGPDTYVSDSRIGCDVKIRYSVIESSRIDEKATIGPYAHLRPNTRVCANARVGNFVETKSSRIGSGAKALHLSYVGDTVVGENANIGAGTITCNYDGYKKYRTKIGARAFIGSNTSLVAPVSVGSGAVVGAGSVITRTVPADSLAITRGPLAVKRGWAKRKRELMKQSLARTSGKGNPKR